MTTISAKIIADSVSPEDARLTTIHLRYPRFIHSELMTHRVFSRNARSSRAVPVYRMIEEVEQSPVIPIHWGAAQSGMQAYQECDAMVEIGLDYQHSIVLDREKAWLFARDRAVEVARAFNNAGYHKQVINRLLEPFMHIDTLVSATDWSNFFALRDHHAAEPHIQKLAQVMKVEMDRTTPERLFPGQWHLPYVEAWELQEYGVETARKLSVARCARISYVPFDGNADIEAEMRRYDLLVGSHPLHASPAEHQASPDSKWTWGESALKEGLWKNPHLHGNLTGWVQFRKTLPGERQ